MRGSVRIWINGEYEGEFQNEVLHWANKAMLYAVFGQEDTAFDTIRVYSDVPSSVDSVGGVLVFPSSATFQGITAKPVFPSSANDYVKYVGEFAPSSSFTVKSLVLLKDPYFSQYNLMPIQVGAYLNRTVALNYGDRMFVEWILYFE